MGLQKIKIWILGLFLLHTGWVQAQHAASMLWKIEGATLSQPSYLLGTLHVACNEHFEIKPKITQTMKLVQAIYFEADIDNQAGPIGLQKIIAPIPGILKKVPGDQLRFLDSALKKQHLSLKILEHRSP